MSRYYACPCGRAPIHDKPGRCINHEGMNLSTILDEMRKKEQERAASLKQMRDNPYTGPLIPYEVLFPKS